MKRKFIEKKDSSKYLTPISIIVFLVPLIVYMKLVELSPIEMEFWVGTDNNVDFFAYYKMFALLVLTGLGILSGAIYFKNKRLDLKKTNIYIPMAIYSLFIILSTLLADHKGPALFGFVDRHEGMFVLLAYMILMFISINMVNDEKSIKAIIYPLLAGAVIIGIIGVFQYIGKDLLQTDFVKKLMLPIQHRDQVQSLTFNFGKNSIYGTLYNPNYVGSYLVLIAPLTITLLILTKNMKKRLILALISMLMIFNLLGSNSRGGLLGTGFAIFILFILLRKMIIKNWKILLVGLGILSIIFVFVNKISDGRPMNQIRRLKNDIKTIFTNEEKTIDEYRIEEVSARNGQLRIKTTEESITVEYEDGQIRFLDEEDNKIEVNYDLDNGDIDLYDGKYDDYRFKLLDDQGVLVLDLTLKEYNTKFAIIDGEFKYFMRKDVYWDINEVEYFGFEGKETVGSSRGYIWSRSIPMLKETIFIGNGPDTYAIHYPQGDFLGRFNSKMSQGTIVDKPHNLYLQIGINTGVISLIAFLAIMAIYFIQGIKVYFNSKFDNNFEIFGLGIFVSIAGYMVTSIFNDSVVSIAPIFWILLGSGVSINMNLLKLRKKI